MSLWNAILLRQRIRHWKCYKLCIEIFLVFISSQHIFLKFTIFGLHFLLLRELYREEPLLIFFDMLLERQVTNLSHFSRHEFGIWWWWWQLQNIFLFWMYSSHSSPHANVLHENLLRTPKIKIHCFSRCTHLKNKGAIWTFTIHNLLY